jgi:hypothetical protein
VLPESVAVPLDLRFIHHPSQLDTSLSSPLIITAANTFVGWTMDKALFSFFIVEFLVIHKK